MDALGGINLNHTGGAELLVQRQAGAVPNQPSREDVHTNPEQQAEKTQLAYRRSEKTTLFVETQEGDVVALKFRSSQKLAINVNTNSNGGDETDVAELQVNARQSTKLAVIVKGDLNADELVAIRNVVDQAGAIAKSFFSGDLAQAFETANALEIDGQQLAKAALGLRLNASVTYSQTGLTQTGSAPANALPQKLFRLPALPVAAEPTATAEKSPAPAAKVNANGISGAETQTPAASVTPAAATTAPELAISDASATEPTDIIQSADSAAPTNAAAFDAQSAIDFLSAILSFLSNLIETFNPSETTTTDADASDVEQGQAAAAELDTGLIETSLKFKIFGSILAAATTTEIANDTQPTNADREQTLTPPLLTDTIDALVAQAEPSTDAIV